MIADIHGKISSTGSNLSERLEDKLTGDIFGVLRYLPSEKLLLPFLRKAYWIDPHTHAKHSLEVEFTTEPEIAFWPRTFHRVEPDVEIKGIEADTRTKMLIEVKYKSGLSSDDETTEDIPASKSCNQLIREMCALYEDADFDRGLVVFLTEDGAYPQEIMDRAIKMARADLKICEIKLFWLSWHEITSVAQSFLNRLETGFEKRMVQDIVAYCRRKGFRRYAYHHPRMVPRYRFLNIRVSATTIPVRRFIVKYHREVNFPFKKWRFVNEE